jgi:hypothetical protein
VIFNTHLLHMALDNKTTTVRKSIIYAYSHYCDEALRLFQPALAGES